MADSTRPGGVKRLVVGMSGASGAILGVRLVEELSRIEAVETHLCVTRAAELVLLHETSHTIETLSAMATVHPADNLMASIASGSFRTAGMAVVPCSMKTVAGIASGYADNLLLRAADVHLKERRPLILCARETPLSAIHLENMLKVTRAGAIVMPPVLSLYTKPERIEDAIAQLVGKILDLLGFDSGVMKRWA